MFNMDYCVKTKKLKQAKARTIRSSCRHGCQTDFPKQVSSQLNPKCTEAAHKGADGRAFQAGADPDNGQSDVAEDPWRV